MTSDIGVDNLVGLQLVAVNFVLDYYVLQFRNTWFLTILNPISVSSSGATTREGDDQFRNCLCGQIEKAVKVVEVTDNSLKIEFEDGSSIDVSLAHDDYEGRPEAVVINGPNNFLAVIRDE